MNRSSLVSAISHYKGKVNKMDDPYSFFNRYLTSKQSGSSSARRLRRRASCDARCCRTRTQSSAAPTTRPAVTGIWACEAYLTRSCRPVRRILDFPAWRINFYLFIKIYLSIIIKSAVLKISIMSGMGEYDVVWCLFRLKFLNIIVWWSWNSRIYEAFSCPKKDGNS